MGHHMLPTAESDEIVYSARYGDKEAVQLLLSPHVHEIRDDRGNSALHMAAANGHEEIVSLLLSVWPPESVDCVNHEGNTPLHWASFNGHANVVKRLLDSNANPEAQNLMGKSSVYEAIASERAEIATLLLDKCDESAHKNMQLEAGDIEEGGIECETDDPEC